MTQITRTRPQWMKRHAIMIQAPQREKTAVEAHPSYFAVLSELNKRRITGELVSITSHKPKCSMWHEVHAVELGYYHYERRVVFAVVRIF